MFTVLVDQAHSSAWSTDRERAATMNPANPADASLALAVQSLTERGVAVREHRDGPLDAAALDGVDVLVVAHPADAASERVAGDLPPVYAPEEIAAVTGHVEGGGGLVVLAECDHRAHGNNLDALLAPFGVGIVSTLVHESAGSGRRHHDNATWIRPELATGHAGGQGPLAGVGDICLYRSGALEISTGTDAQVLARTSATAHPAAAPVLVTTEHGAGRVVVIADSDLVGDDSIDELAHRRLWTNLVTWAAVPSAAAPTSATTSDHPVAALPAWATLKAAVEELRLLQAADGRIDVEAYGADATARAGALVTTVQSSVAEIAPHLPHDAGYLEQLGRDLQRWVDEGLGVPDFLDSLVLLRPETHREDGTTHLVVLPMYTQNGNPDRVFEAVLLDVVWPDWLAEVEARYTNSAFLPVTFVDFTPGYDTNSAVLFPETVAVREVPRFTWGAIFCDREAARFRAVTAAAAQTLGMQLPPEGELLVADQELAQSTFAMWDLVHDRTHSHGDLPFDPFMIKQRMPFWMYALEELRCDLNTFRQAVLLDQEGHPFARPVQLAILFDRLFRFPITGDRVRNYDGLGGQLLFAWLHGHGVLRWTDNTLSIDWERVAEAVVALSDAVEELYRSGIDRSRVGHWRAAYAFVAGHVAPHPASVWAKGIDDPSALPLDGPPKGLTDLVLPDEFPLNVFYEALRKKLGPVIESTKGITAASPAAARMAA